MDDSAVGTSPGLSRLIGRIAHSTLGLKFIMALTGVALFGFLIAHMLGNLLVFQGPDAINTYAHNLQKLGGILWMLRLGLLGAVVLHIYAAVQLTLRSRAARPVAYAKQATVQASYASRTMPMTGLIVLAFIFYHLAHFTFGGIDAATAHLMTHIPNIAEQVHDVHSMVIAGFSHPATVIFYVIAQLLLGIHLSHGVQSAFQSLGLVNSQFQPLIRAGGYLVGWGISLCNIAIPLLVWSGFHCQG